LTVFYDDNHITIDGPTELALHDNAAERFSAYGWQVINVGEDATNLDVLEQAVRSAIAETNRPSLIILRSHIGYPSPEMMDRKEAHGTPFSAEVISATKKLLGVPNEDFYFEPSLLGELSESLVSRREERVAWSNRVSAAGEKGGRLLEQLDSHGAARVTTRAEAVESGTLLATRRALQRAMDAYAPLTPGLTAGSADLTENTGVELKFSTMQSRENPGGRQIHFGIREHAMTAILTGQAHHGGFRPAGSTFFVFSDYARPAVRLAALSHAGTLLVYTHDSIGVGEDGPTHEPIEHLMSLRAMPNLHVVRPSDANETLDLVEEFLTAPVPPTTALVLSRQDMPVLGGNDALASASGARRGAYVMRDDDDAVFTLVGTGSEVGVCLEANDALSAKGIRTRVVAMPCWRCFDAQPHTYQQEVLRPSVPSVAIEAGSTLGWANYVDAAIGINDFGMSAPGSAIFDFFKIVPATVVAHVERVLGERV
jgi:transketolase